MTATPKNVELKAVLRLVIDRMQLTRRQAQIVELYAMGRTTEEVIDALGVRTPTLRTHMSAIYRRLGVDTRTQMLAVVVRELYGVLDADGAPRPASVSSRLHVENPQRIPSVGDRVAGTPRATPRE